MGSAPVSVMVAEIVMQSMKERALATYRRTLPFWFRYVDDTITALHHDDIDDFYNQIVCFARLYASREVIHTNVFVNSCHQNI